MTWRVRYVSVGRGTQEVTRPMRSRRDVQAFVAIYLKHCLVDGRRLPSYEPQRLVRGRWETACV